MCFVGKKLGILGLLSVCVLSLSACKEVLYSDLEEREANEMVAVLAAEGIAASRARDKKGIYEISVESVDIPAAVTLLKRANLPHEKFMSFGDVFSSEGIIATPFEQHARYIHALNQELSGTLTALDHIRSARVLITSPPQGRYDRTPPKATASVTIEYPPGADLSRHVSAIKSIVSHAVPNLDYDDVAVAMFAAGGPSISALIKEESAPLTAANLFGVARLDTDTRRQLLLVIGALSFGIVLALLLRLSVRGRK
ncbi:MAG: type III secretion inner membrane ring lipoprotein SctJ [Pseudomonadota bacterium]